MNYGIYFIQEFLCYILCKSIWDNSTISGYCYMISIIGNKSKWLCMSYILTIILPV